jgi:hypothetical protein
MAIFAAFAGGAMTYQAYKNGGGDMDTTVK